MSKLITYAYFKEETDIAEIVDNKKIDNHINKAQDRLRGLIGVSFYNELVSQNETLPKTLTAPNLAFYTPYVQQYLAWQAYYFYLAKANTYETRTGVRVFKEDNSEPASDKIMGEQLAIAKQNLQFYKEQMINFLDSAKRVSSSAYPLYIVSCGTSVGSGFGITAVYKINTTNQSISNKVSNNEPQ